MKRKIALSAASYPSRIFEDYRILNDSGCFALCSKLSINDAVKQKNSETFVSSFFAFRHRSKVIFRVTQNSPVGSFTFLPKYLALAESPASYSILPMVASLMKLLGKPALYLPVVAFVPARPSVAIHSNFPNLSLIAYAQ